MKSLIFKKSSGQVTVYNLLITVNHSAICVSTLILLVEMHLSSEFPRKRGKIVWCRKCKQLKYKVLRI